LSSYRIRRLCSGTPRPGGDLNGGAGTSRAQFLNRTVALGAGALAGGVAMTHLSGPALSAPSPEQDREVLGFLLLIDQMQAALYEQAAERSALSGELLRFARVAGDHERQHVALLRERLGGNAPDEPRFEFGDATTNPKEFGAAAVKLEDVGMAAYNGQGPNLTSVPLLDAMRIVSVEARHVAWIRDIVGEHPAPFAADPALGRREALAEIRKTGFLRSE
jgi:hypothetical protein